MSSNGQIKNTTQREALVSLQQHLEQQIKDSQSGQAGMSYASNEEKESADAGPGPSSTNQYLMQRTDPTEFESLWACLPSPITSLPSAVKVKQLVSHNSTGRSTFLRSLKVLANGIDRCFVTRPTSRQIFQELGDCDDFDEDGNPCSGHIDHDGVMRSADRLVSLTEALWESHFGVPRDLVWYAKKAESLDALDSCSPVPLDKPTLQDLGLSTYAEDAPDEVVHCALAGTRRSLTIVGPAQGLLYAVVQGSLLVITWPFTERNYSAWSRASGKRDDNRSTYLEELEEPSVNLLHTGDAIYLSAGSFNMMMALSHVSLISRVILNPAPKELEAIASACSKMMDEFIADQQRRGYYPFDHMEVCRLQDDKDYWDEYVNLLHDEEVLESSPEPNQPPVYLPLYRLEEHWAPLKAFKQSLKKLGKKIHRYNKMAEGAMSSRVTTASSGNTNARPQATITTVRRLAEAPGRSVANMSISDRSPRLELQQSIVRMGPNRMAPTRKGKGRAPN